MTRRKPHARLDTISDTSYEKGVKYTNERPMMLGRLVISKDRMGRYVFRPAIVARRGQAEARLRAQTGDLSRTNNILGRYPIPFCGFFFSQRHLLKQV